MIAAAALPGRAVAATVPGVTPGSLAVNERGQAIYSIPIAVPPGIAGMEPSLALNYSSGGGNGLLGMGWSLGGLSVVHRCPKTLVQDGKVGGVDYGSGDRFCLDGKRLVGIGSGGYGDDGKGYRTEINGFFKVESRGSAGGGPRWFEVWTKSGQIMEYGRTADSRIEAKGEAVVRVWAVNKISDTVGNSMTLSYTEATNGGYRIDRIDYTDNDGAGVAATSSVRFEYESREDVADGYLGGSRIKLGKRLVGIETYVGAGRVRDYRLAYEYGGASGRSRLISVTECDDGGDCIKPQVFTWKAQTGKGFENAPDDLDPDFIAYNYQPSSWRGKMGEFVDVDGDGLSDWVESYKKANGTSYKNVFINKGDKWGKNSGFQKPEFLIHDYGDSEGRKSGEFVDLDGDKLPDYVQSVGGSSPTKKAYINMGTRWQRKSSFDPDFFYSIPLGTLVTTGVFRLLNLRAGAFIDVNGDGRTDFVEAYEVLAEGPGPEPGWETRTVQRTHLSTGEKWKKDTGYAPPFLFSAAFEKYKTVHGKLGAFVDLNGDGLPDFIQATKVRLVKPGREKKQETRSYKGVWLNTGKDWKLDAGYSPPFWVKDASSQWGLSGEFVDVNGDGLPDFVQSVNVDGNPKRKTWLNTGKDWKESPEYKLKADLFRYRNDEMQRRGEFIDLNGDGLVDFVQAYRNTSGGKIRHAWLNTGTTWDQDDAYAPSGFEFDDFKSSPNRRLGDFADINGDGALDFVTAYKNSGGTPKQESRLAKMAAADLIDEVTDSLGTKTALTYTPLTDDDVYEKLDDANYPRQDIQAALHVVSEVSRDDGTGTGGQAGTRYDYTGAVVHAEGRGFLGFQWVGATDLQTGLVTSTHYKTAFPFTGQVISSESYFPHQTNSDDDKLVSSVENTWDQVKTNNDKAHFPYIKESVAKSFEINDGWGNGWVTKVTTTSSYDNFGNPTDIVVTTTSGANSFVTTTDNTYDNDTAKWHLGRLTRAKVTNQIPDGTTKGRVSEFEYTPVTGLLKREIVEPDRPELTLTTTYAYDDFGNQTKVTVSDTDPDTPDRVTTTAYDPTDPRFPVSTTNALGHTEYYEYRDRFGLVRKLTGPNGLVTRWEYDSFGRKTLEKRADGTETEWTYEFCDATQTCPTGAVYLAHVENQDSAGAVYDAVTRTYFDALNRVIRQETEGFNNKAVYSDTVFNGRGEVERVSRPYFFDPAAADIQWTMTAYDDIGRPVSVTLPNGCETTTAYDGRTTTTTNCLKNGTGLGQQETRVNDALGRLDRVVDEDRNKVHYAYDHFGNLTETEVVPNDASPNVRTVMTYDRRGRKTSMEDPDMGDWAYVHNAFSELVSQTDAKGQEVKMGYDELGRMEWRDEPDGDTVWVYDGADMGIGKLERVEHAQDGHLYQEVYTYDSLGRPESTTVTDQAPNSEPVIYVTSQTYDFASRVAVVSYPEAADRSRFEVENVYEPTLGYLKEVRESATAEPYWTILDADAEGRVTEEQLGDHVTTLRDPDPATGLLRSIETSNDLGGFLQDNAYTFDAMGNLTARVDRIQGLSETFEYDRLNRLTAARVDLGTPDGHTTTYAYDGHGNLIYKSDVGSYQYGPATDGPHAVTAVSGAVNRLYNYDANGSMESTTDLAGNPLRTVQWTSFNKPKHIDNLIALDGTSTLVYGPGRARIRQVAVRGGAITTITYIGGLFERHEKGGQSDELVHYIRAGGTVAIFTKADDGDPASDKTRYLHKDHLGSIELITDEAGLISTEDGRRSFDPHGKPRNATTWLPSVISPAMAETKRGFTGHEHLASVGLVHMNGRVYDPEIGRFLSADPYVQAPETTQGFNRYSYVNNNPLSYTDPSGFFFKKLFKTFKQLIPTLATIFTVFAVCSTTVGIGCGPVGFAAVAAISGAAMTGITTMSYGGSATDALTGAAIAAGTAFASFGVGQGFEGLVGATAGQALRHAVTAAKAVAHGIVGGVTSALRGGKFVAGLAANAITSLASPLIDLAPGGFGRALSTAVIGGTASELGGGKFANGAVTATFSYLLSNGVSQETQPTESQGKGGTAYVGGAADYSTDGNMYKAYLDAVRDGKDAAYFAWDQGEALAKWIDTNGPNVRILAHSYGADTALEVMASGREVGVLKTVDPVGWTRPDLAAVVSNTGRWRNLNAVGGSSWEFSNFIAGIGGAYNSAPAGIAAHRDKDKNHGSICARYCR